MNKEFEILAAAYLSGELNTIEKSKFEERLKKNDELNEELKTLSQFWNKMDQKKFDTDKAWNNLSKRIDAEIPVKRKKMNMRVLISIAAASILLFGIIAVLLAQFLPGNDQIKYFAEKRMEITLPDASKVILQNGSKLTLDEHFNSKTRTVNLKGEAWFEVEPNKEVPFIIEAARCQVKVVGTKFSVKSKPNEPDKIVVKSGEVSVSHKFSDEHINLRANDNAAITKIEIDANITLPKNYLSWVNHEFYFSNTTLKNVCKDLNHAFNKQILVKGSGATNLKLSATFKDQTIDEIAQIIAQTLNLNISSDGELITLSRKNN